MNSAEKIAARKLAVQIQTDIKSISGEVVSLDKFEELINSGDPKKWSAELMRLTEYKRVLMKNHSKK